MIPEEYLEDLRNDLNIVDIVSEYVELKKMGNNWVSACPFPEHSDSNPSFSVNAQKGVFKCFGCGKAGNMFTFLSEYLTVSFIEAVEICAEKAGVPFEYKSDNNGFTEQLYTLVDETAMAYCKQLLKKNSETLSYLTKQRKLSMETIKRFYLGYGFHYGVTADQNYDNPIIDASGIFYDDEQLGIPVDHMRNRWTFPITTSSGKIVGVGGKSLDEKPSYLNTHTSPIYKKDQILYGLKQAKQAIAQAGNAIIVEGYFDVLALSQNDHRNVVGICSNMLTIPQAKFLTRMTDEAIIFLDGDRAGRTGTKKAFLSLFDAGFDKIKVSICPKGTDPDKLFRDDRKEADRCLDKTISYLDLLAPKNLKGNRREELIPIIKKMAFRLENSSRRLLFLNFCSNRLNIPVSNLKPLKTPTQKTYKEKLPASINDLLFLSSLCSEKLEVKKWKEIVAIAKETPKDVQALVKIIIKEHRKEGKFSEASLYDRLTPKQSKLLSKANSISQTPISVEQVVNMITSENKNERIKAIVNKIKELEIKGKSTKPLLELLGQYV